MDVHQPPCGDSLLGSSRLRREVSVPGSPGASPDHEQSRVALPPASPTAFPMTVVDRLGRKVTLPRAPERIVSLAPKNTELLFAIGAGDQVVGVTSFCDYPREAQTRRANRRVLR